MLCMKKLKIALLCNKYYLLLGIILIGYIIITTKFITYESKYNGNETEIYGKILDFSVNGDKLSLNILAKEKVIVNYYFKTEKEKKNILDNISLGDYIIVNGKLLKPTNNTIPNTFNYKKYLYNKKIFYTFNSVNYKIETKNKNLFYKIKDYLLKRAYKLDNSDYFLVFILGDKTLLNSDDYTNYQTNGTSHLLAVSGMHVGIILGILNIFLKRMNNKKELFVTFFVLLFFLFLTGFGASIIRACLFYILNRLNKIFKWNFSSIQILFITASIILFINPFFIYDLGFIYSFIICGGIIFYSDRITGNYFIKLFKLSLISFLFSLPISACTNFEINLVSVFINLVFVPLISLVVYPFSLFVFLFTCFNPLFSILLNITNLLNSFCTKFSIIINIPKMPVLFIGLYFLFLLLGKYKKKYLLFILVVVFVVKIHPFLNSNYEIYFLDVGQGDSAILISPHLKEVIMIDTGGKITYQKDKWKNKSKTYNLSDNAIKFLKSKGITKMDYLILSHGDADHAGEALNIIRQIKVKNVVLNHGTINNLENKIKMIAHLTNEYKLNYFNIKNINDSDYNDENANSIINYITFDKYSLLFMGDAGIKQEKDLLNKYNIKNIDILKIGHHGSKTSSSKEFIKCINPKYGIISVGKNNKYGHPHKEVIDNLKGYNIYRTDENGSIVFKINKNNLLIETYEP